MAEQEVFEMVLKQLKSQTSDVEVNSVNITKILGIAMEIVKAFVSLSEGFEQSEDLRRELIAHCRSKLGPGTAPREIEFIESLPKTRSGKIMRRLLKARELGLPEGDTSTLEDD